MGLLDDESKRDWWRQSQHNIPAQPTQMRYPQLAQQGHPTTPEYDGDAPRMWQQQALAMGMPPDVANGFEKRANRTLGLLPAMAGIGAGMTAMRGAGQVAASMGRSMPPMLGPAGLDWQAIRAGTVGLGGGAALWGPVSRAFGVDDSADRLRDHQGGYSTQQMIGSNMLHDDHAREQKMRPPLKYPYDR